MTSSFRKGLGLAACLAFFLVCMQALGFGQDMSDETGTASWYGRRHHGKLTASGERYNMYAMTAAHKKLPFGTLVRVNRLSTGNDIVVRITDRGPFVKNRIIDLSYAASCGLGMDGIAKVTLEIVGKKDGFPLSKADAFYVRLSRNPAGESISSHIARLSRQGVDNAAKLLHKRGDMLALGAFSNFREAHDIYMSIAKAYPTAGIILEKKGSLASVAAL